MTRPSPHFFPANPAAGRGFSLIELMIVIAILSVMAGMAAPALMDFVAGARARSVSSELYSAVMLARSEAVKRNANIELNAAGGAWSNGWTVTSVGGTEVYLSYVPKDVTVSVAPSVTSVVFQPSGRTTAAAEVSWVIDAIKGETGPRCVWIAVSGRARQARDSDGNASNGCT